MCGRFCIAASPGEIQERYRVDVPAEYKPRYNASPGQKVLTITQNSRSPEAQLMEWGFQTGKAHRVINARIETLHEKPLFRDLFPHHRCLIPASGFFEWSHARGHTTPFYFSLDSGSLISFAGLVRPSKEGTQVVILTTAAQPPVSDIHDRMPVILNQSDEEKYLSDGEIVICRKALRGYEVSPRVNQVGEDGPELIVPWKPRSVQKTFGDIS